tara:strand:- start:984 stop:1469 length:486 start_codon:yes stop_codon:yes gene_type:complete
MDNNLENMLLVELHTRKFPTTHMSGLLIALQATLREVATTFPEFRRDFAIQPNPVLVMSPNIQNNQFLLNFSFFSGPDGEPMEEMSDKIFSEFMERLSKLIKDSSQQDLWGSTAVSTPQTFESEVDRRIDQARNELRRFPISRIKYGSRSVLIKGMLAELS